MKWDLAEGNSGTDDKRCEVTLSAANAAASPSRQRFEVRQAEGTLTVEVLDDAWPVVVLVNGRAYEVARLAESSFSCDGRVRSAARVTRAGSAPRKVASSGTVVAPMPGRILRVHCAVGDRVQHGQALVVVEAMKMENEQTAPLSGVVREVRAQEGASVDAGAVLVVIEPEALSAS